MYNDSNTTDPATLAEPTLALSSRTALHMLHACLDLLDHGVVVVDAHLQVQHCNAPARRVLAQQAPLRLDSGFLMGATKALTQLLLSKAKEAVAGTHTLVVLAHQAAGITLTFAPLRTPDGAPQVMVSMPRCPMAQDLVIALYAKATGLTAAEASLLHAVVEGQTGSDIAHARNVSPETVRSQLRAVRDKTGCHTLRAVVKKVSELPPLASALRISTPTLA